MRLSPEEIKAGMSSMKSSREIKALSESESRKSVNWAVLSVDGQTTVVDAQEDIDHLKAAMITTADTNTSVIHGTVGNRGKARGKVSIILNVDDFHKMAPGNVLVTTMTTPDYVILMQQAAAIVTDIGGMLCHAAIMSRELGKPCIIGTKVATQVLRDGDEIEVDADKGIVRVLK